MRYGSRSVDMSKKPSLGGERARQLARVADVSVHEIEVGAERADRGEDGRRRGRGSEDANGKPRGGAVRGERRAGVARRGYDEPWHAERRARA